MRLTSTLPHPRVLVESSKWSTRGWTFQEEVLSPRRLVFTDQQILFDCRHMHCAENLVQPLKAMDANFLPTEPQSSDSSNGKQSLVPETPSSPFAHKKPGDDPTTLMSYVAGFNQRTLTFPEDRLNAMQGIFHSFSKSQWPLWQLMGVPISNPEGFQTYFDKWHPSCSPEHAFILGLTWKHLRPGERVLHFPSWTWAGWIGGELDPTPLSWGPRCRVDYCANPHKCPKIWVEENDKSLVRFPEYFKDFWDFLQQPLKFYRFLHIESMALSCSIVNNPSNSFRTTFPSAQNDTTTNSLYIKIPTKTNEHATWIFAPFVLDKPLPPPPPPLFTSSSEDEMQLPEIKKLTAILLSGPYADSCCPPRMLILEDKGDYSGRVGLASLQEAKLLYIKDGVTEWRVLDIEKLARNLEKSFELRKIRVG